MFEDHNNIFLNRKKDFILFLYDNLDKNISYVFVKTHDEVIKNDPDIIIHPLRFESEKIVLKILCKKMKEDIKELTLNVSSFENFFNQVDDFKQILLNGCAESIANELKKTSIEKENNSAINFIN